MQAEKPEKVTPKPKTKTSDELAAIRTLMAAERTYAAWIRTGLAGIGGGLAVIKLIFFQTLVHQTIAHVTGQLLIILGGLIFIFAYWNYRRAYQSLDAEGQLAAPGLLWILSAVTVVLISISGLVFWLTV